MLKDFTLPDFVKSTATVHAVRAIHSYIHLGTTIFRPHLLTVSLPYVITLLDTFFCTRKFFSMSKAI